MHSSTYAPHETDGVQDDRAMRCGRHVVSDALPRPDKMVPRHQDEGLATTHLSRDSAGLGECATGHGPPLHTASDPTPLSSGAPGVQQHVDEPLRCIRSPVLAGGLRHARPPRRVRLRRTKRLPQPVRSDLTDKRGRGPSPPQHAR